MVSADSRGTARATHNAATMIPFLISLLVLLLYAAVAMLIIYIILYFAARIFGTVDARISQLLYCIVALLFVIWFLQSLFTHTPIPAPWQTLPR